MADFDERFRALLNVQSPDLWPEIERRAPAMPRKAGPKRRLAAAVLALAVAGAGVFLVGRTFLGVGRERPAASLAGGRIAFVGQVPGRLSDIYIMNQDGSDIQRLTDDPAAEWDPAWSPDGTRIAFVSDRDGNNEIYVMNADGTEVTRLTRSPQDLYGSAKDDSQPFWSPDGTQIVFRSFRDGHAVIYVMNADGSGQTPLTENANSSWDPAWSPDGARIAFVSDLSGNPDIYVMNADGTGVTRLTDDPAEESHPSWSPDGTKIAFWSNGNQGGSNGAIYVMNADGTDRSELAKTSAEAPSPTWSPDGTKIAFTSEEGAGPQIFVMSADGTDIARLTQGLMTSCCPAWQPPTAARQSPG